MQLNKDVYMLDCTKKSHVYLILGIGGNILIDSGSPGESPNIIKELESEGIKMETIKAIYFTHSDIDHIGNSFELEAATGANLWIDKREISYIKGTRRRPGFKWFHDLVYNIPISKNWISFTKNQHHYGIHVIFSPGHSRGHSIFLYGDTLFTGDLFKITNEKITLFPDILNKRKKDLIKSIKKLEALDFNWICPSHGDPIRKDTRYIKFIGELK